MKDKLLVHIYFTAIVTSLLFCPLKSFSRPEQSTSLPDSAQQYLGGVEAKVKNNWSQQVNKRIAAGWAPPVNVNPGRVVVRFLVGADGKTTNIEILQSSGDRDLDSLAVLGIKTAGQLTLPPSPYDKTGMGVVLDFKLNVSGNAIQPTEQSRLIKDARTSLETGDWQTASKLFDQALSNNPDDKELRVQLGQIYYNQAAIIKDKDPASLLAIQLAKKALAVDPANSAAQELLQGK